VHFAGKKTCQVQAVAGANLKKYTTLRQLVSIQMKIIFKHMLWQFDISEQGLSKIKKSGCYLKKLCYVWIS
jgi:hypothetical protein